MQSEIRSLNEECGLFGIWGNNNAAKLTYIGLFALQHRGQEGAGITINNKGKLFTKRGLGLLNDVFNSPNTFDKISSTAALGHVRYSTAGNNVLENIQPLPFNFSDTQFAIAHNGNLTNAISLRKKLESQGAIYQSSSDSENIMHLIRLSKAKRLDNKVKESLKIIKGGFAFLIITKDRLYAALDPNGFRPLVVGQLPSGGYVVCSETCALNAVGAQFKFDIKPGQLIKIDDSGIHVERYTNHTQLAICSMEYIYFSRPDSDIYGVNIHAARKKMGKRLAKEHPVKADIVTGVPNSSLSAAIGYAEESGLPYEMGLIKNQYSSRTFIEPTQELRQQGVDMKLSPVKGVVAGKKVVLVDDSIVRGTTSKRIVKLLKHAGASEVHLRIASPPLRYPCFYGIDIQHISELIAAHKTVKQMRKIFQANSLGFLSIKGLIKSVGLKTSAPNGGLCVAYFNGHYPTPLYDYDKAYKQEQKQLLKESLKRV